MRINKTLGVVLVTLLLVSMAVVVSSSPWDGVPDDPTPAQAIWVDPKNPTGINVSDTFVVDVLINITDPPGAGTGLYGFQYTLKWNSTMLDAVEIQTHTDNVPSGDLLQGWTSAYVAANKTGSGPPWAPEGFEYHLYAVSAMSGTAFKGVASLCTYTFRAMSNGNCTLDIYDEILADDTPTAFAHTTVDGYAVIGGGWPVTQQFAVTWKWSDANNNPVWLSANVTLSSILPIENFSFNRSLGQISFDITSISSRLCNVTFPKAFMDGAFKVFVNDAQAPCLLAWNKSHTFVCFSHSQGTHNIKIIGEVVTRIRGPDLLTLVDVNGDGIVDIVDLVTLALRFGWEENG